MNEFSVLLAADRSESKAKVKKNKTETASEKKKKTLTLTAAKTFIRSNIAKAANGEMLVKGVTGVKRKSTAGVVMHALFAKYYLYAKNIS